MRKEFYPLFIVIIVVLTIILYPKLKEKRVKNRNKRDSILKKEMEKDLKKIETSDNLQDNKNSPTLIIDEPEWRESMRRVDHRYWEGDERGYLEGRTNLIDTGAFEIMINGLGKMTWVDAKEACEALGQGWRLPTISELMTLRKVLPQNIRLDFSWSHICETENAFMVDGPNVFRMPKNRKWNVLPVRTL